MIGTISKMSTIGRRPSGVAAPQSRSGSPWRRRWLAFALLALLADLSVSLALHRHASHADGSATLHASAPSTPFPATPTRDVSLEDVCALCGALAGFAICTTWIPLELDASLDAAHARSSAPLVLAVRQWWDSTASRAPPQPLSLVG